MGYANRRPIPRQGAITAPCGFCVASGLQCSTCYNLFVVGDLRVHLKGTSSAERVHFFCMDLMSTAPEPVACDLLHFPHAEPRDHDAALLLRAGHAAATEIERRLHGYSDAESDGHLMARIIAAGYLVNLHPPELALPPHRPHVGPQETRVEWEKRVCDFCEGEPVFTELACETFAWPVTGSPGEIPLVYEGGWRCCRECAALADKKDNVALARRAMTNNEPSEKDPERRRRHFEGLYAKVIEKAVTHEGSVKT